MNKVVLLGRLTGDPDVRMYGENNDKKYARYTIACDRYGKKEEGQQTADFIGCVAYGKAADFADTYLRKGMKIAITGRIQTGRYTNKEGQTVYTTDVVIESQEFCESRNANQSAQEAQTAQPQQTAPTSQASAPASQPQAAPAQAVPQADMGFINIPDGFNAELPFS